MRFPKNDSVQVMQTMGAVAFKVAAAAGGLLMMIYCMGEGVLPENISLGDGVFLVWCLISFGFVSIVGTFYGAAASLWIVRGILWAGNACFNRRKPGSRAVFVDQLQSKPLIYGASPVCFAAFALAVLATDARADMRFAETVLFFVVFGGFLVMAFGVIPIDGKRISWKLAVLIFGGVLVMALVGMRPALLNFTMSMLGIRSLPGEAVVITEAERVRISGYAKLYGIEVVSCDLPGQGQSYIPNAYVVWHAVGATSYLRLAADAKDVESGIVVPTPRKDLTVIGRDRVLPACQKLG